MSTREFEPIYIVGAGKVGTALAMGLSGAGLTLAGLWTRTPERARQVTKVLGLECAHGALPDAISRARTIIISVVDPVVQAVAGALLDGGLLRGGTIMLHCGGSRPAAQALANIVSLMPVGTFHPLLAVASPEQGSRTLAGAHVAVEGDPQAVAISRELAQALGAHPFQVPAEKMTLYHVAAVLASNHVITFWQAARRLMMQVGLSHEASLEVLLPLLRSTVENTASLGLPEALTGPIRRGDAATVKEHLDALRDSEGELKVLYQVASRAALEMVQELADSPGEEDLDAIRRLLNST